MIAKQYVSWESFLTVSEYTEIDIDAAVRTVEMWYAGLWGDFYKNVPLNMEGYPIDKELYNLVKTFKETILELKVGIDNEEVKKKALKLLVDIRARAENISKKNLANLYRGVK